MIIEARVTFRLSPPESPFSDLSGQWVEGTRRNNPHPLEFGCQAGLELFSETPVENVKVRFILAQVLAAFLTKFQSRLTTKPHIKRASQGAL
jgi:hypothetical protein